MKYEKVLTPALPVPACGHCVAIDRVDENDDRTRVLAHCLICEKNYSLCFAKRLADTADADGNREAWGPVGLWTSTEFAAVEDVT